jgi:hypothetical protein
VQRRSDSAEANRNWSDSLGLGILGGLISQFLYNQIEKHGKVVKEALLGLATVGSFYLITVGSLILMTNFLTFPLDDPAAPWAPSLIFPLQTYFIWGIPFFVICGLFALASNRSSKRRA